MLNLRIFFLYLFVEQGFKFVKIMMNMKRKFMKKSICLLIAFTGMFSIVIAQNNTNDWNTKNATKWVQQNKWKDGLKLNLDPSTDKIAFATQYHKNKQAWDKAFTFLRTHNLDSLPVGKYSIDGDKVFATVTVSPNKEFDQTNWESHHKYLDLQYVISGKEKIGVAALASATVTKPYDGSKDVANYTAEGKYYIAQPGTFFLFFPTDVHRPNIKVEGYDSVKKIVIKIDVVE
jgi:biofilm protein TabA